MNFDPMEMKRMIIQGAIDDLGSGDKKKILAAIEMLGNTLGIGAPISLETEAVDALNKTKNHTSRRIRKATEKVLHLINERKPRSLLDMFSGGVGFSSKE